MNTEVGRSSLWNRLLNGVKWNVLEAAIVAAGNFAGSVLAARLLGLDDFGAFSIIRSTVYMMASVAGMGLGITATKYIAEFKNANRSRLANVLGLCSFIAMGASVFFAGALLLFAPHIAVHHLNSPQLAGQLQIAAFYILFVTLNGYQVGILVGFEDFSSLAKLNFIQVTASLAISFLLTWGWGLTGASIALGLTALINWTMHHLAVRRQLVDQNIKICYHRWWEEKQVVGSFAFPAALSGVIGAVAVWACNAIVVRQTDGLAQMAIFAAAYHVRSLVLFVPSLVTRVAAPIFCNLAGEKDQLNYSRLFWFNIVSSAAAAVMVAGGLVLASPYLLALFGRDFTSGGLVVTIVAVMSVVEVIATALYQPLYAYGRLWWQLNVIVCWSAALIGLTYFLAGSHGALGLAYAYLAAHLVSASMYFIAVGQISRTQGINKSQHINNGR